jgi:hypothetical protein
MWLRNTPDRRIEGSCACNPGGGIQPREMEGGRKYQREPFRLKYYSADDRVDNDDCMEMSDPASGISTQSFTFLTVVMAFILLLPPSSA